MHINPLLCQFKSVVFLEMTGYEKVPNKIWTVYDQKKSKTNDTTTGY